MQQTEHSVWNVVTSQYISAVTNLFKLSVGATLSGCEKHKDQLVTWSQPSGETSEKMIDKVECICI